MHFKNKFKKYQRTEKTKYAKRETDKKRKKTVDNKKSNSKCTSYNEPAQKSPASLA